ncbi:MAG: 4-hydroxythreonine-4-phosphate dehydrogenase PdxA [Hyphomicrobiales bacterium]|nr:4-hydroxythreonine-4-phosphate dehydrogenase PdxA [Hyphomicrobiales bacterium]
MITRSRHLPLALSQGDPSGIGPEVALKAWMSRRDDTRPFFVLGDPDLFERTAQALSLSVPVARVTPAQANDAFATALPVLPIGTVRGVPGRPDAADAPVTIAAIEQAVALVQAGEAAAVVTNPISKDVLYGAGFRHPGHTEFLGELAERHSGGKVLPVMMLWSPALAVVPVTIHVSLARAIAELTTELIVETGRIVAADMRAKFRVASPRLAVAGLNPHAGENGAMGREDIEIVAPAVARLRAEGIDARGPLPPDTLFHATARTTYDAVLCMYHDQALIPIKTLAFDSAVNLTLGLPFIRTSPDHGTAFDIAGQGVAHAASLIAALDLAALLADRAGGA